VSNVLEAPRARKAARPATSTPETGWKITAKALLSGWNPVLLLVSFACLIFWRLSGVTQYDSDDYTNTQLIPQLSLPTTIPAYSTFMAGRNYLLWFYKSLYLASNHNLDLLVLAFVGLYAASAILLFACLRRVFSVPAAMIGAALYLAHGAKWHAVLAYNAQAYILVSLAGIGILWALTSNWKRGIQCLFVVPLYWASIHLYEVLIATLPIYPLFWLGPSLVKKRLPRRQDLVYSAIPFAITALHVHLLSLSPAPLYRRYNPALGEEGWQSVAAHAQDLIASGASKLIGPDHVQLVQQCVQSFFRYDLRADHSLWIPLVLACAATGVLCGRLCVCQVVPASGSRFTHWCVLISGLILAFAGPLIALPLNDIPSRIMILPTLGFAFALAAVADLVPWKPAFRAMVIVIPILCLVEAVAFSDIVRQLMSGAEVDKKITQGFLNMRSLHLVPGARVFVSLPFNEKRMNYWRVEPPVYYNTAFPTRLWAAYSLGTKAVTYASVMRYPTMSQPWGVYTWTKAQLQSAPPRMVYPFYLDETGKMRGITQVSFLNKQGRPEEVFCTGLNGQLSKEDSLVVATRPDVATQPWCWLNCSDRP